MAATITTPAEARSIPTTAGERRGWAWAGAAAGLASVAIMLLVGSGEGDALTGLQNLTILAAAPFIIVMIFMCVALMRDLRRDPFGVAPPAFGQRARLVGRIAFSGRLAMPYQVNTHRSCSSLETVRRFGMLNEATKPACPPS